MEVKTKGGLTHWGNIRGTLGLYWDNGKENGNYHRVRWVCDCVV